MSTNHASCEKKFPGPVSAPVNLNHGRIQDLDILRGMIIVLMAIDHVAFFIMRVHPTEYWGRLMPVYTSNISFLTRAITHPCAPGFFFLMGISVFFVAESRKRVGWDDKRISSFLIKRGLILIAIELFFLNFAWLICGLRGIIGSIEPPGGGTMPVMVHFGILCCLGCNLIFASLIRKWPPVLLLGLSFVSLIVSHSIIPEGTDVNTLYSPILRVLFIAGRTQWLEVGYPIIPWLTLGLWGVCFGHLLRQNKETAMNIGAAFGIVFLVVFLLWRVCFGGGDFHFPADRTFISYLNVTKYPPSIDFITLTMGVILPLLFAISKLRGKVPFLFPVLSVFGRTPFFFYVLHVLFYLLLGTFTLKMTLGYGAAYMIWLFSLGALFPLCLWFGRLKSQSAPEAIIRFF